MASASSFMAAFDPVLAAKLRAACGALVDDSYRHPEYWREYPGNVREFQMPYEPVLCLVASLRFETRGGIFDHHYDEDGEYDYASPDLVGVDILSEMAVRAAQVAGVEMNRRVRVYIEPQGKGGVAVGFSLLSSETLSPGRIIIPPSASVRSACSEIVRKAAEHRDSYHFADGFGAFCEQDGYPAGEIEVEHTCTSLYFDKDGGTVFKVPAGQSAWECDRPLFVGADLLNGWAIDAAAKVGLPLAQSASVHIRPCAKGRVDVGYSVTSPRREPRYRLTPRP